MSFSTSVIPFGMGCIGTWIYTMHRYQEHFRTHLKKEQDKTMELEEEIVRLKREMRVCGIRTSSEERLSQENHTK